MMRYRIVQLEPMSLFLTNVTPLSLRIRKKNPYNSNKNYVFIYNINQSGKTNTLTVVITE